MPTQHLILCHPLLLLPLIFPSIRVFSDELVLRIRQPKYWSFSFSISLYNEYSGLISFRMDQLDPCSPRDAQESSPTPQFKTINSLALSLLYGPTLTPVHAYCKNHSFDQTDLCWQSNVSAFQYIVQVCHSFSFREQESFNFIAAVTIHSDFGAQEKSICHCFHFFPFCLP